MHNPQGKTGVRTLLIIVLLAAVSRVAAHPEDRSFSMNLFEPAPGPGNFFVVEGLGKLASVGGGMYVEGNHALASLEGVQRLSRVGGDLRVGGNPALANLDGLGRLASVGANIAVHGNEALTGLDGLRGLSRVGGNLEFHGNTSLPQCEVCAFMGRLEGFAGALSCFNNRPDTCPRDCT